MSLEIGAAYIRVSTDDQTELSPDAQLREILKAARADGYAIPKEFIFIENKGRSGRRADNRPEFQRMIAVAKTQPSPFQRLYLWKFSRFARNQEESTFYKGILRRKCGIDVKSVSEPIMEGMFGRLIEMIIEWFDEYYSINLSGEVMRGMTEKALRGGYQSTPCLGYDAIGRGKPFVINEEKYAIAAFIHRSYHEGKDITAIVRECNARGYRTRKENRFDNRAVKAVLTNQFYTGLVVWNGISFNGLHETREEITAIFQANQERLAREFRPAGRREVSSCAHWLSGLLVCSRCGASLGYKRASPTNRTGTFQCWKYAKGLHEGSCSISAGKAEAAVLKSLCAVLKTEHMEYKYICPVNQQKHAERETLKLALQKLERKEQRVQDAYENGLNTPEEYQFHRQRLRNERDTLLSAFSSAEDTGQEQPPPGKTPVLCEIHDVCDLISNPDIDNETKGNALRRIVKKIEYDSQNKTMKFHYYI